MTEPRRRVTSIRDLWATFVACLTCASLIFVLRDAMSGFGCTSRRKHSSGALRHTRVVRAR